MVEYLEMDIAHLSEIDYWQHNNLLINKEIVALSRLQSSTGNIPSSLQEFNFCLYEWSTGGL